MSRSAIARNYAGTLLELATREDAAARFGERLAEVADLYRTERTFRRFLDTPRVEMSDKLSLFRDTFGEGVPEVFLRFLLVVIEKRRARFLPEIESAYRAMVDEREGRVHATVTLAREPDEELRREIVGALNRRLDRDVVPHFRAEEDLLGGVVVRVEDRLLDGSLRRRLELLRRRLRSRPRRPAGDRTESRSAP